ncbi:Bug family tripartite tricarboxylate transporter substrate binding protein [Tepidicella baoligensis]|uniref:Bug family tripartite tricarboxylate transporter substrate binding protein n=1 Tax=Tepidicella baoligensis TaxID=2707016 RepID=UPI0015D983F3|nr:tripartite tricarboxylate transporter substrate binding protein [Tepidicella baoligensis]
MISLRHKALVGTVIAGICLASPWALAQNWKPTQPVTIIVPIAGTTNDTVARLVAPKLAEKFGQPFVVDNKPGAGGNLGASLAARAAPDGHTLLVGYNGPLAINPSLFTNMPFDPQKDLAPITLAVKAPQYLVTTPGTGITNVKDFIAQAKAAPQKFSYGSVAVGSASHLTMEMFKSAAGINVTHIPYRGAPPAIADLLAGTIHVGFFVPGNVQQLAQQGRIKLLASSGKKRFASTPDVPTLAELGFENFEATSWIGFLTASNTPKHIIQAYNTAIVEILKMPDVKDKLESMEFEIVGSSPDEFASWIDTEIKRWGAVIKETGTKLE